MNIQTNKHMEKNKELLHRFKRAANELDNLVDRLSYSKEHSKEYLRLKELLEEIEGEFFRFQDKIEPHK